MKDHIYTIGMICRAIWPDLIEKPPLNYFDKISTPATLLALMIKHPANTADKQDLVTDLVDRLPADFHDPKGGVAIEDQSPFWLGYYHLPAATDAAQNYGPDELRRVGEALFGTQWQTDLARELNLSDARRVRQWLAGERKIPVGVWADICQLLRGRQIKIDHVIKGLEAK